LIDPNGVLMSARDKAAGRITNGVILTAFASQLNMQIDKIGRIPGALAKSPGCDYIVNLNKPQDLPDVQSLKDYRTSTALRLLSRNSLVIHFVDT